jgi:predicted HicB family RNase H-like nuclease
VRGLDTVFRFRLPAELLQAAKEKARREDVSLAQVLRRCLRKWIEDPLTEEEGSQENK